MKRSNYTIVIPLKDSNLGLLVHSYTGAMDLVGPNLLSWFTSEKEESVLPEETVQILNLRGYLWDDRNQLSEEKIFFKTISEMHHKKNISNAMNTFWIIPTYRCNLRCYYCFQNHKIHAGEGIGKDIMSISTIKNLFSAFGELGGAGPRAKEGKGRYITLFGGEPMMAQTLESVEAIVSHAIAGKYRIGAITNGVELNLFENLLGPDKIRWIQITLDGLSNLNDKRRFPVKGDGFWKIVENISLALNKGCQVSLRTNTDQTILTKISELESFAEERGWTKKPGFNWYMTPVESHVNKSSSKFSINNIDIIKQVQENGNGIIRAPYRSKFSRLLTALETDTILPNIETSACGAHTSMYYFDPSGLIYSCAEQVGKEEFAIGRFQGSTYSLDQQQVAIWLSRHVGNMPVCSSCQYAFFCGGGCANAAKIESGNFLGPRCYGIKESFQHVASEYAKNKITTQSNIISELEGYEMKHLNSIEHILPAINQQKYFDKITASSNN